MVGESLPAECNFHAAFGHNFPLSGTNVPLNNPFTGNADDWQRNCGYKSRHPNGANFLMADASMHFFPENIDYMLYNALGTRDRGETASPPPR